MKTFSYKAGHAARVTMTVTELIEKLKEYPQDMPVFAEWETTINAVKPEAFEIKSNFHFGKAEEACDVLVIDVEGL